MLPYSTEYSENSEYRSTTMLPYSTESSEYSEYRSTTASLERALAAVRRVVLAGYTLCAARSGPATACVEDATAD